MLKIFVTPGHKLKDKIPARLPVTDIVCPGCGIITTLIGFGTLRGRYATTCTSCNEFIPPVFDLLESSAKRRAYHRFQLGANL